MTQGMHPGRQAIEAMQLTQLRKLIAALVPGNRFYAPKLQSTGITPEIGSLAEFSQRMPYTFKQELADDQRAYPPFGTNLSYPIQRYTRYNQTSATTGAPLRWLDTPDSWDWMLENWRQVYMAAGVRPGDKIFFAFSFGPFLGFWTAYESGLRMGCLCIPAGGASSLQRLHMLLGSGADVLCCTPTYGVRLGEVAIEEGLDIHRAGIKTVIVAGEPGANVPAIRAKLEALGERARVFDHHGMTEVGPVSYESPCQPGTLHIIESSYYAEVIDPKTGKHVEPGQTGELVLTTLGRLGSPLLRYRTGDIVRPIEGPSPDGRWDMGLEGGILGRADDMLVVRGVNIFPSAIEEIITAFDGVAEYRIEVSTDQTMAQLNILVEPTPMCADPEALATQIRKELLTTYPLRIGVTLVDQGQLPRFEMKAKRWVQGATGFTG